MSFWIGLRHNTPGLLQTAKRWKSTVRKIEKLLIANRGEIACRIIRTAKRLGIKTVAVYSEADENALHVALADEAYKIGPSPAILSYLCGDKLLQVAERASCHAIHPGYGFLSENVEFAEKCLAHQIAFVGPPAAAIRDMGIKSKSKEIMAGAGVPVVEGYHGADQRLPTLQREAARVGFPVMIKAVRGGGGKGMRVAHAASGFEEALESARSEARKAFGDDVVLLERFVAQPRHVEVQVFADMHGNAVHLFERDCSVQRRHQKIIEEAPAPGLAEELRERLGAAAVKAAKAVGYVGAGTVEFILDRNTHSFHFMEMNTRLQVEHPITEMITGTDLVEWQLKVANGETLPLTQSEIKSKGHAFEARIYAEDPDGGFLPGAGTLVHLAAPTLNENMRIETGVRQGDEVSVHYDPMIAKLVVWGEDRSSALKRLENLLLDYNIAGLETNINFLLDLAKHPEFVLGNVHTNFIQDNYDSLFTKKVVDERQWIQAAVGVVLQERMIDRLNNGNNRNGKNPFFVESHFRVNYKYVKKVRLQFKDVLKIVFLEIVSKNLFNVSIDEGKSWKCVSGELQPEGNKTLLKTTIDDVKSRVNVFCGEETIALFDYMGKMEFLLEKPSYNQEEDDDSSGSNHQKVVAPMPGVLDKVLVKPGDCVKKGESLFVLIAMKMEFVVKAGREGRISGVNFKSGDNVQKDAVIVQFEEEKLNEKVVIKN